jgi:hypothetical protein
MTFDEISTPYLEGLGFPDQTNEFDIENEKYVQWF